ncbi:MAG: nucleotidyltransferase domain-containing protein [Acidobacteria bacterium]|nr:nucleotidyltransferase domain-containing protein [Acidobacteriota bacterium]
MEAASKEIHLEEIIGILVDQYGPIEKIILFGSYARGDADEYSDLDLILVKKTTKRFVERLVEVPLLPVHADVFVYTPEEFEQMKEDENPFIMSALESARVLYERPPDNGSPQSP